MELFAREEDGAVLQLVQLLLFCVFVSVPFRQVIGLPTRRPRALSSSASKQRPGTWNVTVLESVFSLSTASMGAIVLFVPSTWLGARKNGALYPELQCQSHCDVVSSIAYNCSSPMHSLGIAASAAVSRQIFFRLPVQAFDALRQAFCFSAIWRFVAFVIANGVD